MLMIFMLMVMILLVYQQLYFAIDRFLIEDGMVSCLISMDSRRGKLLNKPIIMSRGFVYMKDSFQMIREAELLVSQELYQNCYKEKQLLVKSKILPVIH